MGLWSCLCLLTLPGQASAREAVKLQLKWHHQFQFAGYYAALEKGYYRDAGLNVQILEGGPNINVANEVKSGRAEFGVGTSSALLSRARGDKIVVLAVIFQHSPSVVLVTRKSGITSIKAIQNRRFMDAPDSDDIAAMFKAEGVDYRKIPRVPHDGDPRNLVAGKADAMLAYSGNQAFLLKTLGVPCREFSPRSSGIDFYGDNLITTDQEIADHPGRAEAFRAASMKGWKYAFAHKEEIASLILRRYTKTESRKHLLHEASQYEPLVQPNLVEVGYQNPTRWQTIANSYKSLGMLQTAQVPQGLIYQQESHAAPRWLVPLLLAVLAISLAGFGISMRNSRRNLRLQSELEERRRAELAIAAARDETEATHRQLLAMSEALPLAMYQLEIRADGKLHYNFVSRRAAELLGVPYAELLTSPDDRWRHVHPDDVEQVLLARLDTNPREVTSEADGHVEFTARVVHGGTTRWLLTSAHAARQPDGTTVWNGFYQDVTNQKQAEATITATNEQLAQRSAELAQALGNTSSRLQGIMDNSPAAIWAKDENGVYLFANHAYRTMFGVDDIEIEGRTDDDFFPPDAAEGFRDNDRKVIRESKTSSFVEKVGLPNGVEFVLSVKFPLINEEGKAYAAAGMCLDITEQLRLQEELKKLNEGLEGAVELRTAELSQAYEALRDSEARLSKTTENAPCLIYQFMLRPDGSAYFPYCSAFTKTYFGVEPEAVREDATPILSLFHPDDVPGYLAAVERAVANQDVFKHEWRIRFPDGRITWVQAISRPEFVEKGGILWNGVLMDITDLKHAEEALRHSQTQLQGIIDNSPAIIFMKDMDGRYILGNRKWEELTGLKLQDAIGHTDFELFPFDSAQEWVDHDRTVLASGVPSIVNEILHRDGKTVYFLSSKFPFLDANGNPFALCGMTIDVTETKRAEETLREREAEFRTLVDNIPGVVYRCEAHGNLAMQFVSDEMERLTGYPATDFVGEGARTFNKVIHPDDREARRAALLNAVAEERPYELEYRMIHRDGSILWVSCMGQAVRDEEGKPTFFIGSLFDVTQRKQIEEDLHAARLAADESNKAKSDFLANMSHEIRTPMNAVIGMTHLALQTDLDDRQRNYLQKIDTSARNLLGIINDILDFSKIEAGKLQMEIVDFNLDEVLQNVADMFMPKAQERDVEFLLRWEPGVPALLTGDPLRIGQILINLTSNAFKFTEKGEVEVRVEKIAEVEESVTLQFSVRDTGIGLTEAQQGRLFQAFSQADASTTRKYGGTGLGLTICKRLVEMMQGRIWLESEAGIGTTFFFTAVLGKSIAAPSSSTWEVGDLAGLRVLVVDDNATSREILQGILETFHFEAVAASSGQKALEMLRSSAQPFDLVLMDWQMPDMDGIEVSRRIRSDPQLPVTPPIIMVSAYGREELMRQAVKIGISGFLIKPVSPSLLLDTIMQVFGKGGHLTTTNPALRAEDEPYKLSGLRVLLVEDNEINCDVAVDLLSGAGIVVTVAHDGQEGVAAVRAAADAGQLFDAVLMDCQMPVLDGYDATRALRQEARFTHLPIIAMTANAMAGDREQCLAAGMNDYVSKPIDVQKLFATIARLVNPGAPLKASDTQGISNFPNRAVPESVDSTESVADIDLTLPGVDLADGLSHVGGNRSLYRRILTKFHEGQAGAVEEIRAAHASGDYQLATRLAHTLKGVAGNIGAIELFATTNGLEQSLREQPGADIETLLRDVEAQLDPLLFAIAALEAPPAAQETSSPENSHTLNHAALQPLLEKLEALLQRSNTGANTVVEEIKPLLAGTEGAAVLTKISRAISDYDFDAALAIWPELARLLEESPHGA